MNRIVEIYWMFSGCQSGSAICFQKLIEFIHPTLDLLKMVQKVIVFKILCSGTTKIQAA